MSYDLGGEDLRVVSGINLILNVMRQLENIKTELETVSNQKKDFGLNFHINQIKMIAGTAGDPIANDFLVMKLNQLNEQLNSRFPHVRMIMRKTTEALDACQIAISKHFQKWEKAKIDLVLKSLGSGSILEEPYPLPTKILPNKYEQPNYD